MKGKRFLSGLLAAGIFFGSAFSAGQPFVGNVAMAVDYDDDENDHDSIWGDDAQYHNWSWDSCRCNNHGYHETERPYFDNAATSTDRNYKYNINTDDTATIVAYIGSSKEQLGIPSDIDGHKVTAIGRYAFNSSTCSSLKRITIPDSVTYIGKCAFKNCGSLEKVYFLDESPSCLTSIGYRAFFQLLRAYEYRPSGHRDRNRQQRV